MNKSLSRLSALGIALALAAAGCSSALPQPHPTPVPATVEAVLTPSQVQAVAGRIAVALGTADVARDAGALAQAAFGPAAKIRAAQYTIATATGDSAQITAIPAGIQSSSVSDTDTWPRSSLLVTEQPEDLQPQRLVVVTQPSARENYAMWAWVRLFPGAALSLATPAAEIDLAGADGEAINAAVDGYVDVLNNGAGAQSASQFNAEDELRASIESRRAELTKGLTEVKGTYSYAISRPPSEEATTRAWSLADGGTLVVTALTARETAAAPKGAKITPDAIDTALLAGKTVTNRLVTDRQIVVAMVLPVDESAIQVVGAENARIAASLK
ncbi:hypothetical protein GCM10010401_16990 [Rarobacter faecitabidus]|uniref:DUF8094 domain-containing protein n=1 Tax=Rarobacter faecitabidus TaxID=13243 RepID=A0A542ZX21_RARFA|nr:hypothetical protein [Rarobacter faecitabidus]TQL64903.1 hypothetical protein FB461_1431 [Rarobacter faecitabidus]